jgi:nucleoside-diphosphate-sugar epimerase
MDAATARVPAMTHALLGHSGFVGSLLKKQTRFDNLYRSTDIIEIHGREFDCIVCAAAPAQKWLANKDPEADHRVIDSLIGHISRVTCRTFILVSTVDVYQAALGVDEGTPPVENGLHAYGLNRLRLERFVQQRFDNHLVVRLPGLVGPGLRKNVIFDLLNDNNLSAIDSRGVFQFYPLVNLWFDIQAAVAAGLKLVHLTAEPISVKDVALQGFNKAFEQELVASPAVYDMRSRHAAIFGASGAYQYTRRESIQAIRAYAQSECRAQGKTA